MVCITDSEYAGRMAHLQTSIRRAGLDVLLVSSFDNILYLTGACYEPLERPFTLLVHGNSSRPPVLLVPKLDADHMRKARGISRIVTYREFPAPGGEGWAERLTELVVRERTIGIEADMLHSRVRSLDGLPLVMSNLVERQRLVKSRDEIGMIRRAALYADLGVKELFCASYRGSSVAEGFARTSGITRRIIREVTPWDPLTTRVIMATWAAPRSGQPHSVPALEDRLVEGPHVALVLTRVNGYAAESERTYFTARPTREMRRAFRAMEAARAIAFDMIRPAMPCAEIDAAVNAFLKREGYADEDVRLHRTGHGLGLGNHEGPWLAEGDETVLEENMVISVEPGIYLAGHGGYRHSDTVVVTDDGHEPLTRAPRTLDELVIRERRALTRLKGMMVRRALRIPGRTT